MKGLYFKPRLWVIRNRVVKKMEYLEQAEGWFIGLDVSSSLSMSLVKTEWLSKEIFVFGNREFGVRK